MSNVWQAMENVRDTFTNNTHITRELLEAMLDQHKAVVDERDALKAHTLSLTDQLDKETILDSYVEIQEWFERKPEVSLERVKLLAKAEIVEEIYNKTEGYPAIGRSTLANYAIELRRQARGL